MNRLAKDTVGALISTLSFIVITALMIKRPESWQYLPFFLFVQFLAFAFFSVPGAAAVAAGATFVAGVVLIIGANWIAVIAVAAYWAAVAQLNSSLADAEEDLGRDMLELENTEIKIGEKKVKKRRYSQLIPSLEERVNRYDMLADFSIQLSATFDFKEIYSFIKNFFEKIFPDKNVSFVTDQYNIYDSRSIKEKKPILVENTFKDFRFKRPENYKFASLLSCPLFQKDNAAGVIRIESIKKSLTTSDMRLAGTASSLANIALDRARLFQRTEELAITDSLTGLYTHSYFMERLQEEVNRAARYNENFTVLMLDIDNFKEFNDTYGHQAGDTVLKKVARALTVPLRETDVLGRYGGEEFSVILCNIKHKAGRKIAERIRKSVESTEFKFGDEKCRVTVTVGGAYFPRVPTGEQLIRRADEALYRGKKSGKNKVTFSGD